MLAPMLFFSKQPIMALPLLGYYINPWIIVDTLIADWMIIGM
jgi:hypothetical protein